MQYFDHSSFNWMRGVQLFDNATIGQIRVAHYAMGWSLLELRLLTLGPHSIVEGGSNVQAQ
jgi:hypothetical protein